jgi:hypothetical protein
MTEIKMQEPVFRGNRLTVQFSGLNQTQVGLLTEKVNDLKGSMVVTKDPQTKALTGRVQVNLSVENLDALYDFAKEKFNLS